MRAATARRAAPKGVPEVFDYPSPIGLLAVRVLDGALTELHFGGAGAAELPEGHPVRRWLALFFAGQPAADVPYDLRVTPFQRAVLEATRSIPRGEVRTYGWIARRIGKPGAARAVGQALGANPLPLIIPCHRVVGSGNPGGYGGGMDRKAFLLALERG